MTKKLIAGNWKMNLSVEAVDQLIDGINEQLNDDMLERAELLVCPPSIYIDQVVTRTGNHAIEIGGQDCSDQEVGAYTGQVSASMLAEKGCSYVILGHSERRQYNAESSALVQLKASQALAALLTPIICVGESAAEREAGEEESVVGRQLQESIPALKEDDELVIAYEPVWAIGTGKVASPADVDAMHNFIRKTLEELVPDAAKVRILYGGSMKPDNAQELLQLPNVDGGLIGGASLKADQFLSIASCA